MDKNRTRLNSKLAVKLEIFWAFLSFDVLSLITNDRLKLKKDQKLDEINTWPFCLKLEKARKARNFKLFEFNPYKLKKLEKARILSFFEPQLKLELKLEIDFEF